MTFAGDLGRKATRHTESNVNGRQFSIVTNSDLDRLTDIFYVFFLRREGLWHMWVKLIAF